MVLLLWKSTSGNSLAAHWLGLCSFTAKGPDSIPGQGTKILQTTQHGQKEREKNEWKKKKENLLHIIKIKWTKDQQTVSKKALPFWFYRPHCLCVTTLPPLHEKQPLVLGKWMGIAGFYFDLIHNHRYSPKFSPQAGVCQCLDDHLLLGWYGKWALSKIQTVTPLTVSAPPRPPFKLTDFSSQKCSGCSSIERRRWQVSQVSKFSSPQSHSWAKRTKARAQGQEWAAPKGTSLHRSPSSKHKTLKPLGKLWIKPRVVRSCRNPREAINHYCQLPSMSNKKKINPLS